MPSRGHLNEQPLLAGIHILLLSFFKQQDLLLENITPQCTSTMLAWEPKGLRAHGRKVRTLVEEGDVARPKILVKES